MTKVRISMGASSTSSFPGFTAPPLVILDSPFHPSAFHTSLFFSISDLSWLPDKLISTTSPIYRPKNQFKKVNIEQICCSTYHSPKSHFTCLPGKSFFSSTCDITDRSLSSPIYSSNQNEKKKNHMPPSITIVCLQSIKD